MSLAEQDAQRLIVWCVGRLNELVDEGELPEVPWQIGSEWYDWYTAIKAESFVPPHAQIRRCLIECELVAESQVDEVMRLLDRADE